MLSNGWNPWMCWALFLRIVMGGGKQERREEG